MFKKQSILLFLGASFAPSATGNHVREAFREEDYSRSLLFGNFFGRNQNDADKPKVPLGEVCGNNNPCMDGLDCTHTSGITYRICLPVTCVQEVMDEYNVPQEAGGRTPFEEHRYNVLAGAGVSPTLFEDHMETDLLNQTTLARAGAAFQGLRGMAENVLDNNFRTDLIQSMRDQQARDASLIQAVETKARDCFAPYINPQQQDSEEEDQQLDHGHRNLQGSTFIASLPGFFLEFGAIGSLSYNLGVLTDPSGQSPASVTVHDICFGAGPAAGAGTGFLMQFWWGIGNFTVAERIQDNFGVDLAANPHQAFISPIPALMVELDAAAGLGVGVAYNTIGFGCHRLFVRAIAGAGGGLTVSTCVVALCGAGLPGGDQEGGDDAGSNADGGGDADADTGK